MSCVTFKPHLLKNLKYVPPGFHPNENTSLKMIDSKLPSAQQPRSLIICGVEAPVCYCKSLPTNLQYCRGM